MKRIVVAGFAAMALAVTGACAGDDADVDANLGTDTEESAESDSAREYCEFSAELDARGEKPSEEDFDRIVEVAPDEIKDDVETLVTAIRAGDEGNEEAMSAGARLEAWEDENCPEDAGDADAGSGGDEADEENGGEGPSSGEAGEAGGDDSSGETSGDSEDDGDAGAEVEAEVGGDDSTTTTR
ncbi:MAG TPA: hypothetical protein VMY88_12205 [Acidimicrobiales bacterium]|nr:hypothetical protein [Acidimicrobiales bacterium]